MSYAAAYRAAYRYRGRSSDTLGSRLASLPRIRAEIKRLQTLVVPNDMDMAERRRLLTETARAVPQGAAATHTERIAAIREHAILAGERSEQVGVTADVQVLDVMRALERMSVPGGTAAGIALAVEPAAFAGPQTAGGLSHPSLEISGLPEAISAPTAGHSAPLCSVELDLEDE